MTHQDRPKMSRQPNLSFDQVYNRLTQMPGKHTPTLCTTGRPGKSGVEFVANAKTDRYGVKVIDIPKRARIFPCCWGNTENHYGKERGTRIGLYVRPLDDWASGSL